MASSHKIAFIKASWHSEIVDQSLVGFRSALDLDAYHVEVFDVPGAFELPLLAKTLSKTAEYDAIVCAALVVDGGIYRHDFVSATVVEGLMQVQLETGVPVLSVSLTPHNFQPTPEHIAFFSGHFVTKGEEAAQAVTSLLQLGIYKRGEPAGH